ncbi:3-hydroxyacyl-CoA dehydrogenase/Enoyl-CoA hydratase [Geoglobus ahangari]|uniref:3-hydroxyacyl-CoA dehydrogenase/Enoyl-CoA hydratase n=1 Tax=Geoglobus ahangari TaxID=113653 RepID=A0A0F7IEM0_9EURY|nr:3-hydroxyacyl-CoA dehydrogenase/enoyl-CoA hydratase family protein [Geoglobus ahangari]AKG91110.1 3-hydroxyacyl-CoA dehydrogenase/Enoyl-CoA hydratase [Geoglobus ahangari]
MKDVRNVLVIGAGTMGHGIAELCALAGYSVTLVDVSEEALKKAMERIAWSLSKLEKKKGVKKDEVLSRITTSTDLPSSASNADLVIEAVVEKTEVKKEVFRTLDENCRDDVILATNTSTIPIAEIASATSKPERVLGLHFFNPPTLIRLVEIVVAEKTSEETVELAKKFVKSLGMDYITARDVPGFVVNRINLRVFGQAIKLLESGYSVEEIDACAKYRIGIPMGLFEVIDFSGVDVLYNVIREMSARGFDVELSPILEEMVREGRLGMKTGRGFYTYEGLYGRARIPKRKAYAVNPLSILAPAINEACWIVRNKVSSAEDVEKAMKLGMGYRKGVLELADVYGLDRVVEELERLGIAPDQMLRDMVDSEKLGKKSGEGFFRWRHERKSFGPVSYEKRHSYAIITLKRAERLNALNEEMWVGIRDALLEAERDEDVRAVLITGEGRAFSAGDDIAVMRSWKSVSDGKEFFERVAAPLIDTMIDCSKPLISLVNGYAYGGGMELNLLMDIVIASKGATFSVPEGLIGAFPPIASTVGFFLNRRVLRYCLTAEEIQADEALEVGIADLVVDDDQLEIAGVEVAERISELAPMSIQAVKKAKRNVLNVVRTALESAVEELIILSGTADFEEGMRAFLEKRRPVWRGE